MKQLEFQFTSLQEDSPAKTSASPEKAQGLKESAVDSGSSSTASSKKSSRATRSSKTSAPFALADWTQSSAASLRSAMTRSGTVFPLPPLALLTGAIGSGSWPTPQARDYRSGDRPDSKRAQRKREQGWSINLNDAVQIWPTASARDYKDSPGMSKTGPNGRDRTDQLPRKVYAVENTPAGGGQLNPTWVEWLMGFPVGWTDLNS